MRDTVDWRKPAPPAAVPRDYGLVPDGNLGAGPPSALIKQTVPMLGLVLVAGQSRSGKTFVTLRMAVELARSRVPDEGGDFLGRRVRERVGVIYVLTEGAYSVDARMKAVKLALGITENLPITFVRFPPGNLLIDKDRKEFIASLTVEAQRIKAVFGVRVGAVIIDTVTAGCAINNEGDNSEVSKVTKILREFGTALKAVTIAVHHLGKNAENGPRGASSWIDKVEAIVTVTADIDELTGKVTDRRIATTKNRDAETGPLCRFDLVKVDLGEVDEDGDPIDSCTIEILQDRGDEGAGTDSARVERGGNKPERTFYQAFWEVCCASGKAHHVMGDRRTTVKAVNVLDVRALFWRRYPTGKDGEPAKEGTLRSGWSRALDTADFRGFSFETVDGMELVWSNRSQAEVER